MMPTQKPGRSEQSVGTPPVFLSAVVSRFGPIDLDVAAGPENAIAPRYYTADTDGLAQSWRGRLAWCNPPYAAIAPWVSKATTERDAGASVLMLLPAAVGSNWWRDYVHGRCVVYLLNGRLTFVGHTSPYPKDLVLLHYAPDMAPAYHVWNWRKESAAGREILVDISGYRD